ncbi:TspO/MBR family protein [uncultured Polaribacter sp.]|uniref:TspO/MBR family protein n=1 Tax=uncultured Polaribacter sp. TaxID=174711 RepID=UPI000A5CFC49|nr:TspO protein [Polaribacter sp.]
MKQLRSTLLFLILNFGGLAIGSWLMNGGPLSDWYTSLNQAPWTPPGFVFGIAWTLIMLFFSVYLGRLFSLENTRAHRITFLFQFVLNVSWNYVFFNQHLVIFAFIILLLLTALLFIYYFRGSKKLGAYKYLLLPYIAWLCVASSLNLYILVHN